MLIKRPFEWWARRAKAEGPSDVYAGAPVYLTPAEVEQRRAESCEGCVKRASAGPAGLAESQAARRRAA